MTIDPDTGLPQLPEGFFFRVHQPSYSSYHYVTIFRKVRKRFLFWTYIKDQEQIFKDSVHPSLTEENVLKSAKSCVEKWEQWKLTDHSLVGDYPPKKLGA